MERLHRIAGIVLASTLTLGLAGCETDGAAEEAGENIDEAVEDTRDAAQEAGEELRR
jgi:hypothetical protein